MVDKYKVDGENITRTSVFPDGHSTFGKWTIKDFKKLYPKVASELFKKQKA